MALTIIAVNQTGTALPLTQLMAPNGTIAASGQVQLTDYNWAEEILRDEELRNYITTDDVLLTVNNKALTKSQSLEFRDAPTVSVKPSYAQSSSGPTVNDDADSGYSIGSMWITTGGVLYYCVDDTPTAASWVVPPSMSDTVPQPLGTASAGTGPAASRDDHVHAHGDLVGGPLHADATFETDGFLGVVDKHWVNHGFDSGLAEGGELSYGALLVVNVTAGEGFVNDADDEATGPVLVSWVATNVSATANTSSYIYVTSAGVVSISPTEPGFDTSIILGIVRANATVLTFISEARPSRLPQNRGNLGEFIEDAWGGIATAGLATTVNATNTLRLDVTTGTFYISGEQKTATATAPITFTYWYQDGVGGWVTVPNVTTVNVTNYDDGDGTLGTMATNSWKKELLFVCGNGDGTEYHMVYAQDTYNTESQATAGFLPTPPEELRKYAARFAGIVVQQGGTAISEVTPELPNMGQNDDNSGSGIQVLTAWVPVQSSSALSQSNYGRQIVVPIAQNGSGDLTFFLPPEAVGLVYAKLIGIPSVGASGTGKNIDLWADYGTLGESPTTHQGSDLTSVYDLTGTAGLITTVVELSSILTNLSGGDIVGLEVKHNAIGGAIEYLGISLAYEVVV